MTPDRKKFRKQSALGWKGGVDELSHTFCPFQFRMQGNLRCDNVIFFFFVLFGTSNPDGE